MNKWPKWLGCLGAMALVALAILSTRYREIDLPVLHFLRGRNRVDPLTLHLSGEFVEGNLGLAQQGDGSLTLRMIAQQYLFIPHCVVVPADVPIHLRITSADAVHLLTFSGTETAVTVVPGNVSQATLKFVKPGLYQMPCREFCGAGHYDMRSRLLVVPSEHFTLSRENNLPESGGDCAIR